MMPAMNATWAQSTKSTSQATLVSWCWMAILWPVEGMIVREVLVSAGTMPCLICKTGAQWRALPKKKITHLDSRMV